MTDIDPRALNSQNSWTDAAVELLKRESARGTSGSQIAKKLKGELGVSKTRNAVIGKIIRMKFDRPVNGRASSPERLKAQRAKVQKQLGELREAVQNIGTVASEASKELASAFLQIAPTLRVAPVPVSFHPLVTLLDLEAGQCRMVVSDDDAPQPLFCGCRCERGRRGQFESYCGPHQRVTLAGAPRPNTRGAGIPAMGERQPTARFIGRRYNA